MRTPKSGQDNFIPRRDILPNPYRPGFSRNPSGRLQAEKSGVSALLRPVVRVRGDPAGGYRLAPPGPTTGLLADTISTAWAA
jgi:hypothetical protein